MIHLQLIVMMLMKNLKFINKNIVKIEEDFQWIDVKILEKNYYF